MKIQLSITYYGILLLSTLSLEARSVSSNKHYKEITTMSDCEAACNAGGKFVVVFNSAACTACDSMEPAFNKVAREYKDHARFYTVNSASKEYKGIKDRISKKLNEKLALQAYPTTYFFNDGCEPLMERGAMEERELDMITYKFVHGKPKTFTRRAKATKPAELKKSLQEPIK